MRKRLLLATICVVVGVGAAEAGQLGEPQPYVYARAEDQLRARLLRKPCAEADVGRGCYRFDDRLVREFPCTYHIDVQTIGSVPIDQCYKMDKPRRYRGVWIDAFEGQQFIPEGTTPPEWPGGSLKSPSVRARFERAREATIWLDVERVPLPHDFKNNNHRMFIEFIGRKTLYPGWYGHLGMSGSEIIVDRVISAKDLK